MATSGGKLTFSVRIKGAGEEAAIQVRGDFDGSALAERRVVLSDNQWRWETVEALTGEAPLVHLLIYIGGTGQAAVDAVRVACP